MVYSVIIIGYAAFFLSNNEKEDEGIPYVPNANAFTLDNTKVGFTLQHSLVCQTWDTGASATFPSQGLFGIARFTLTINALGATSTNSEIDVTLKHSPSLVTMPLMQDIIVRAKSTTTNVVTFDLPTLEGHYGTFLLEFSGGDGSSKEFTFNYPFCKHVFEPSI